MTGKPKHVPSRSASPIAASWGLENWPPHKWPNSSDKARYVARAYRDSLLQYGAIARVGKTLVVFERQYERWLQAHATAVPNYELAPNKAREMADAV